MSDGDVYFKSAGESTGWTTRSWPSPVVTSRLNKDAPISRPVASPADGDIVAIPQVGGLHIGTNAPPRKTQRSRIQPRLQLVRIASEARATQLRAVELWLFSLVDRCERPQRAALRPLTVRLVGGLRSAGSITITLTFATIRTEPAGLIHHATQSQNCRRVGDDSSLKENRVLCKQIGARRLRFTDDQRQRLAVKGGVLGAGTSRLSLRRHT